jgi:hypothetical protein
MQIKIVRDDDPPHPRKDWDNLGTILYTSSRYVLGDKEVTSDYLQEVMDKGVDLYGDPVIWLPVYAYIHGGVVLNTSGFSCRWDSGQCGIIMVSKAKVKEEWKKQRISPKLHKQILQCLESEVKTYSQYLEGDVWGYVIEDDQGEQVESCYGFFGYKDAEQEAEACLKNLQTKAA